MRELAPLLAALVLGLSPLPASAITAVFDFDDFPYSPGSHDDPNPLTFLYGCNGKDHCTGEEVANANFDGDGAPSKVSTTRNGIFMELSRWSFDFHDAHVHTGNGSEQFNLFLLDFDTPLRSFSGEISRPRVIDQECDDDETICTDIYEIVKVYLWSETGGQGDLVGSLTITPYDPLPPGFLPITVSLVSDAPFRSVNFGHAISLDPSCIGSRTPSVLCYPLHGYGGGYSIDDIVVSTVPEPSTAVLVGFGLLGFVACRRRRLAPLLVAALGLSLSPLPASAVSALFDFGDFPGGTNPRDPLWNAPYTYLYRCDGKDYCTGQEALSASTGYEGAPRKIATTRNGISMEFSRGGYTVNYDGAGVLDDGDDSEKSFELFLFDFDTPLQSFQGEISAPSVITEMCDENDVCTDIYSLVELYLWSDPGGQGTLVGSLTLTHDDVLGYVATVSLITDQPFRSANFGHAVSGDPDSWGWGPYNSFGIDYILVSTVPEPSTAALVCLGLVGVAAARRPRPIV